MAVPALAASLQILSPEIAEMYEFCIVSQYFPHLLPQDIHGRSPLFYAITFRCPQVLEFYLQNTMYDVNAMDCMGNTALSHAIQQYDGENPQMTRDMLHILLKYGANPNQTGMGSHTPLMLAALREDVGVVNALLIMGADPNMRLLEDGLFFKASDTALSLAIRSHTFLGKPKQSPGQLECIYAILQNTRVPITPNVLFHALQQTKDPVIKAFIMEVSK